MIERPEQTLEIILIFSLPIIGVIMGLIISSNNKFFVVPLAVLGTIALVLALGVVEPINEEWKDAIIEESKIMSCDDLEKTYFNSTDYFIKETVKDRFFFDCGSVMKEWIQ